MSEDKKETKEPIAKPVARKKSYSGVVISPFKVKNRTYRRGDKFNTEDKRSLDYLIKIQKLR